MPEYLLTGRSPTGQIETVRLEVGSADQAVKTLQKRGYEEIVLHTDDVSAHYTRQSDVDEHITPAEYVRFRYFGGWLDDVLFCTRKMYSKEWYFHLAAVLVLAVRRYLGWPWGTIDVLAVAWLAFPVAYAAAIQFFNSAARYSRVIDAIAWGRWEEALRRLPGVRSKIPTEEAAFIEAQALAGLGRLDEAMSIIKPFADDVQMPAWMYWGRLGDVYFAAGRHHLIIPAQEKAAELAPDNPTVLLDLAMALVRYRQETVRSRQLVQQARTHALSDVLAIFADVIEGMVELEDGNPARALMLFEQSIATLTPFRNATPLIGAALDRTYAYLALAYAALGEREQAEDYYRRAEPRLRALGSNDLIARCEMALQGKPAPAAT